MIIRIDILGKLEEGLGESHVNLIVVGHESSCMKTHVVYDTSSEQLSNYTFAMSVYMPVSMLEICIHATHCVPASHMLPYPSALG